MSPRWVLPLVLCLALCPPAPVRAAPETARDPDIAALARDATWLRLLHHSPGRARSDVLSTDFFLSSDGHADPAAELSATLAAHEEPWAENPDGHPRCRFPARYRWLSTKGLLPGYAQVEPRCAKFQRWIPNEIRSASVLLVSGYFGNPASTFGHVLLKLDQVGGGSELFDLTFNFGALVPPGESTAAYVFRGITGGYEAGFSDRYYYTEDITYSRREFRDVWVYELALAPDALELLYLHVWEVLGKKFAYFFLTQNCAYRIAELLQLATGSPFVEGVSAWYSPIELFHRLQDLDRAGGSALIERVRYVPSSERSLLAQLNALTADERRIVRDVGSRPDALHPQLARVPIERQGEVADTLLAYFQHRLVATEPYPDPELVRAKQRVLAARLQLPPQTDPRPAPPDRSSPAQNPPPLLAALGVGLAESGGREVRLRWAMYSADLLGRALGDDDEMVALDIAVRLDHRGDAGLDFVDLVRIRRTATQGSSVGAIPPLSWTLQVGGRRRERSARPLPDAFARVGIGWAHRVGPITAYAMMDGVIVAAPEIAEAEPNVGVVSGMGRLKASLSGAYVLPAFRGTPAARIRADARVRLSHRTDLRVSAEQFGERTAYQLALHAHW